MENRPSRIRVKLLILLTLLFVAAAVWQIRSRPLPGGSTGTVESSSGALTEDIGKPDLEVLDVKLATSSKGESICVGSVRNNTEHVYRMVTVILDLYDDRGERIGSAGDKLTRLNPNTVWRFQAPVYYEEAANVKVRSVNGYK